MNKKENKIEFIFTLTILLIPIINIYESPIDNLPVGDVLLFINLIIFGISMVANKANATIALFRPLFKYIFFIIFQYLFYSLIKSDAEYLKGSFFTTFHYIFYLIFALIFIKKYFNPGNGFRIFKLIAVLSTFFIFIQEFALRVFSRYIPGHIPGIKLTNTEIMEFNNTASNITDYIVRGRSFFPEPAHYAQYVLVFLAIDLGTKKKNVKDYLISLILSVGILVSRSSTGIILCIFIWMYHLISSIKANIYKIKLSNLLIISLMLPLIVLIVANSSFFNDFLSRFITSNGFGRSTLNRFEVYTSIFNFLKTSTILEIFFGHGMVEQHALIIGYMPGFIRLLYYFGIFGVIILVLMFIQIGIRTNKHRRLLLIILIIMNIGGDSLFGSNLLLFMPFLIHSKFLPEGAYSEDKCDCTSI